ncbi:MAG TPA: YidB family protein [Xanthobacteraceae bacterium]|jgi:uncharacterized protein YidB (DUF937 family)
MGLFDVIKGMQNGPRGQVRPSSGSGGGMSPITMAVLGLIAYKALKSFGSTQPGAVAAAPGRVTGPGLAPGGNVGAAVPGGGVGDLLKGGLGGLLAGGAAGSALSGGLADLLNQFQQKGQGDVANSWVGTGPNRAILPNDLASALGAGQISALMSQFGLSRDELLAGLSQRLPEVIDELTPDGRLPTEQELSRRV